MESKNMNNFSFNSSEHNFWPVYDAIKFYYPIGIKRADKSVYFDYPGIKKLEAVVVENIHNTNSSNNINWVSFQEEISRTFNIEVTGTTYGSGTSFSCDLIIEKLELNQLKSMKKLSLAVSLLGKFFTIYGADETSVIDKNENIFDFNFRAINVLTISPYKEFEILFKDLKSMAEARFTDYKFVPFAINSMYIKGLQVRGADNQKCTIYKALFNHSLDNYDTKKMTRGDKFFGYNDWITENYNSKNEIIVEFKPTDTA